MSLINPGLGDVIDRLTILARKKAERPEAKHFPPEFTQLLAKVDTGETTQTIIRFIIELAAINATIWERINMARELVRADRGGLALSLIHLNDTRQEIVAALNKLDGKNEEEKIK